MEVSDIEHDVAGLTERKRSRIWRILLSLPTPVVSVLSFLKVGDARNDETLQDVTSLLTWIFSSADGRFILASIVVYAAVAGIVLVTLMVVKRRARAVFRRRRLILKYMDVSDRAQRSSVEER